MNSLADYPNTFAWFCLVSRFSDKAVETWPKANGFSLPNLIVPAPKKDDDIDDLFGDDNGDAEAAATAVQAAKQQTAIKKKKEVIAMSLVMLEVKPLDDTINLDDVAKKIFAEITQDGLFWKTEYKKEPVAFGIFKLIIGFSLEDEKVSVDDIVEKIESMEDFV